MSLLAPPVVLAMLVAAAYAGLFNLWRKGSPRDLLFYLLAAWVGFGIGQIAGLVLRLDWLMIGSVYMLEGTLFCWATILIMQWLRMPKK